MKTKETMCDETACEPVGCDTYTKSRRETFKSSVRKVDIGLCVLTMASFATRLINLNLPSAVV